MQKQSQQFRPRDKPEDTLVDAALDADMSRLHHLSLIRSLIRILTNHLNISDRTLAEYLVDLYEKTTTAQLAGISSVDAAKSGKDARFEAFRRALPCEGGITETLVESLWRTIYLHFNPPPTSASTHTAADEESKKSEWDEDGRPSFDRASQVLPALAMPNKQILTMEQIMEEEARANAERCRSDKGSSQQPANGNARSDRRDHGEKDKRRHYKDAGQGRRREHDDDDRRGKGYDDWRTDRRGADTRDERKGPAGDDRRRDHGRYADRWNDDRQGRQEEQRGRTDRTAELPVDGSRKIEFTKLESTKTTEFKKNLEANEQPRQGDRKPKRRLTSPERFEIKQLIASGVVNAAAYAHLFVDDPTMQVSREEEQQLEPEEDVDIELREEEPRFLKGHTQLTLDLSPVKIVKNPEGSMNRAALSGVALASERREVRQQQQTEVQPQSVAESWADPLSRQRLLASDAGKVSVGMPEWRRATFSRPTLAPANMPNIHEQRQSLPIYRLRAELMQAIHDHQILVVIGETGSGKTTQMTQYLLESGYTRDGKTIGCTQPRRVAAMSVAKRVAEEVGCQLGTTVGYTIRFEDCTGPDTRIKYMTDGMLLRECLLDTRLSAYSVVMLDEAHERTIHTDVLFGLLKKAAEARPNDFKLVVTSATLDAEKFSAYFKDCPIFTIPGRAFSVEVLYTRQPETDYMDAALVAVMQIHLCEPSGDILLFLTGQEEIDTAAEILYERMKALGPGAPELLVLPVYSALPAEMQSRIFEPAPPGGRKVVIATNIAETSITIDGIYYVVDPGFCKQKAYNPKLGMDTLMVVPISQAQARQRAGRAGRTGPGKCFRLYTEQAYLAEMLPTSIPEIQRTNLANTVLTLKAMGINDLLHFDFMDPPPLPAMITAMEALFNLGALDDDGFLTRLGRKMAEFPLEPPLSKMLIYSVDLGCSEEVLTIVAMLSVQNVFFRPKDKQSLADTRKARFHAPEGDHLTLLTVYNAWKSNAFSTSWCFENFIQSRSMRRAQDVRKQLASIMERYRQGLRSCGSNWDPIRKAICAGFFMHATRRDPQEGYRTLVEQQPVYIHPSSALFNKSPEWLIYHELVMTSREYMRECLAIDPRWLVEVAPTFFKMHGQEGGRLSRRKREERIIPLHNKHEQPDEWRISKQRILYQGNRGRF